MLCASSVEVEFVSYECPTELLAKVCLRTTYHFLCSHTVIFSLFYGVICQFPSLFTIQFINPQFWSRCKIWYGHEAKKFGTGAKNLCKAVSRTQIFIWNVSRQFGKLDFLYRFCSFWRPFSSQATMHSFACTINPFTVCNSNFQHR